MSEGFWRGYSLAADFNAHQAERSRDEWMRYAKQLEATLKQAQQRITVLEGQIQNLRLQIDYDACALAGVAAQGRAMREEIKACPHHENHPLRDDKVRGDVYDEAYINEWKMRDLPGDPRENLE